MAGLLAVLPLMGCPLPEEPEVVSCGALTVRETFYEMMPRGDGTEQQYLQRRAMNFTRALKKAVSHGLVMRRELGAMATLYRPADIRENDPEAAA